MVDEESKKDKFEFDSSGETVEYISMDQAHIFAMRTAMKTPGEYGCRRS